MSDWNVTPKQIYWRHGLRRQSEATTALAGGRRAIGFEGTLRACESGVALRFATAVQNCINFAEASGLLGNQAHHLSHRGFRLQLNPLRVGMLAEPRQLPLGVLTGLNFHQFDGLR